MVVLPSIFLFTLMLSALLKPLEDKFYDICLSTAHDSNYVGDRLHPSLRLLAYSESTEPKIGDWTSARTDQLADLLLQNGATQVVFLPGSQPELKPSPHRDVTVVAMSGEKGEELSAVIDGDGVCRRVALGLLRDGRWTPSLSLRLFAKMIGVPESEIKFLARGIGLGSRTIATDDDYQTEIRFRRSVEVERDYGMDLLVPVALETFWENLERSKKGCKDKTFLVGTRFKQATDLLSTPLGQLQDFKVQACILESLLLDWTIWEPVGWQRWIYVFALVTALYAVFSSLPIPAIALLWLAGQYAYLAAQQAAFQLEVYLPYLPFVIASTSVAVVISVAKFGQARHALKRFGGLGALEAANRGDESVFEEVREKTATIVFTNVLNYLKELERHGNPDHFFERRQAYAQLLSDVFRKHGGVILDYQGDFQMVGFNVELRTDDEDHAVNAVKASREFLARVPEVTKTWWEADDHEIGAAHCGICTGPVACGHVGSERHDGGRIAQAAIGDTSNVAARLLGAAMKQKEPILLAMTTVEAAQGRLPVEELEPIPLKGKALPVQIARPLPEEAKG